MVGTAQDVLMQGWYWEYPKTAAGHNFADSIYSQATQLAEAGFTHMWLPPFTRANSGSFSNGYDPRDIYDLGEYGLGPTGFGTRSQLDAIIDTFTTMGVDVVADVVYNHRDGGWPEQNLAVQGWVENFDCSKVNAGDQPYPSDRYRYRLPIGGTTGRGPGSYYIKVQSRSGHPNYNGFGYSFLATTNFQGWTGQPELFEDDGNNNGASCGSGSDGVALGRRIRATLNNSGGCGGSCQLDEFRLIVQPGQYDINGDNIYISLPNDFSFSDHYISEVWYNGNNVKADLILETFTDFTSMPSGRGGMDHLSFKPNGSPTNLGGDWDAMIFYYDIDQWHGPTKDSLFAWTEWLFDEVGVRGLRLDAIKHFDPAFVADLLDYMHDQGKDLSMIVGEFFDTNPGSLNGWASSVYNQMDTDTRAAMSPQVFDFTLRYALKDACDAFGYDVRNLYGANMVANGGAGDRTVTFCNNHDFRENGQPIWNDPDLAYAFMFLHGNLGTPCVYYPDYFGTNIPHTQGLKLDTDIDILIDVRKKYIANNWNHINLNQGFYSQFFASGSPSATILMQVKGGGGNGQQDVVAVINFSGDPLDVYTTIEGTNVSPGNTFVDVTGKALLPTTIVNGGYEIRAVVPPRSFALYVKSPSSSCTGQSTVYVDNSATGQGNGLSWEDASTYLPAALQLASTCSEIDTIKIAAGDYGIAFESDAAATLSVPNGIVVYGGYPAGGSTTSSRDLDLYPTTITGAFAEARRILYHGPGADTTVLDGITIEAGMANGSELIDQQAAGLLNYGKMHLRDVAFEQMSATAGPEVILNRGAGAYLSMQGVEIEGADADKSDVRNDQSATLEVKTGPQSVLTKP